MTSLPRPRLDDLLADHVRLRTGRRIRDLTVQIREGAVHLSGTTLSFHVKQLALVGAREIAPDLPVRNGIAVVRNRSAPRKYT